MGIRSIRSTGFNDFMAIKARDITRITCNLFLAVGCPEIYNRRFSGMIGRNFIPLQHMGIIAFHRTAADGDSESIVIFPGFQSDSIS